MRNKLLKIDTDAIHLFIINRVSLFIGFD